MDGGGLSAAAAGRYRADGRVPYGAEVQAKYLRHHPDAGRGHRAAATRRATRRLPDRRPRYQPVAARPAGLAPSAPPSAQLPAAQLCARCSRRRGTFTAVRDSAEPRKTAVGDHQVRARTPRSSARKPCCSSAHSPASPPAAASLAVKGDFVNNDGKRVREPSPSALLSPATSAAQARPCAARTGRSRRPRRTTPTCSIRRGGARRRRGEGRLHRQRSPTQADGAFVSPLWRMQTCTQAFRAREARQPPPCPIRAMEKVREHNNLNKCTASPNWRRARRGLPQGELLDHRCHRPCARADWATTACTRSHRSPARPREAYLEAIGALPRAHVIATTAPAFAACAPRCSASRAPFWRVPAHRHAG